MLEVHTETEWLHDTVPSWVKWRLSLGASAGRRDSIHGPIHSFARTEKTRHCLVHACRRAANTPTRVAAFEECQRQGPAHIVGRVVGTSRSDDGQRHLRPEYQDMATPEDSSATIRKSCSGTPSPFTYLKARGMGVSKARRVATFTRL